MIFDTSIAVISAISRIYVAIQHIRATYKQHTILILDFSHTLQFTQTWKLEFRSRPYLDITVQSSSIPGHYSPYLIHTWTLQSTPHPYLDITVQSSSSIPGHYSPVIIHTRTLQSRLHPYLDIIVQTSSIP